LARKNDIDNNSFFTSIFGNLPQFIEQVMAFFYQAPTFSSSKWRTNLFEEVLGNTSFHQKIVHNIKINLSSLPYSGRIIPNSQAHSIRSHRGT
jgi:hypothetical protein